MYELIRITDHNYYMDCPTKVGFYESAPGRVWLIDSGSDKDAGKKVYKLLTAQGWTVEGILLTHSHADHLGGAQLLSERCGCSVYAETKECAFARNTVLEPALLYGACPPIVLRNKFLVAPAVLCRDLSEAPLPAGLEVVDLPGHSPEMVGFRTPEGVFFCADAVCSEATLEKYHISYVYDVQAMLDCLLGLEHIPARWVLPAHAELTEDIAPLARKNREKMQEIMAVILDLCREPKGFEDILAGLAEHFGLELNWNQYVLTGSTLRAYLAYLLDFDRLEAHFAENRLHWQAKV